MGHLDKQPDTGQGNRHNAQAFLCILRIVSALGYPLVHLVPTCNFYQIGWNGHFCYDASVILLRCTQCIILTKKLRAPYFHFSLGMTMGEVRNQVHVQDLRESTICAIVFGFFLHCFNAGNWNHFNIFGCIHFICPSKNVVYKPCFQCWPPSFLIRNFLYLLGPFLLPCS